MRMFLTGVSCVGKTTIGKKVAELLGIKFFDLDQEIERFFQTSTDIPPGTLASVLKQAGLRKEELQ